MGTWDIIYIYMYRSITEFRTHTTRAIICNNIFCMPAPEMLAWLMQQHALEWTECFAPFLLSHTPPAPCCHPQAPFLQKWETRLEHYPRDLWRRSPARKSTILVPWLWCSGCPRAVLTRSPCPWSMTGGWCPVARAETCWRVIIDDAWKRLSICKKQKRIKIWS